MHKRLFHATMTAIAILGWIGLSFELAFTDMSVDRQAMVGSIWTLQTIAILMIVAGKILQPTEVMSPPSTKRRSRTRKKRLPLPLH